MDRVEDSFRTRPITYFRSPKPMPQEKFCFFRDEFCFSFLFVVLLFCFHTVAAPTSTELAVKIKVAVGDGEPIESAIRRFKREVNKSGHLMELRHRRHFENSQDRKKRKIKEGRMRKKFERLQRRRMMQQQQS